MDKTNDTALNISLPHRPSAFPDWLGPNAQLPVDGVLRPFSVLAPPKKLTKGLEFGGQDGELPEGSARADDAPERACVSPTWPPVRPSYPSPPFTIALVERGGCDFATKVLAAQERGVAAVVVGDSVAHPGETDEEGRSRENLITMFSPGEFDLIIVRLRPFTSASRRRHTLSCLGMVTHFPCVFQLETRAESRRPDAVSDLFSTPSIVDTLFQSHCVNASLLRRCWNVTRVERGWTSEAAPIVLLTNFTPLAHSAIPTLSPPNATEDTTGIIIPSVFVSRASYLILRDLLSNHSVEGKPGLLVDLGEASDDGR